MVSPAITQALHLLQAAAAAQAEAWGAAERSLLDRLDAAESRAAAAADRERMSAERLHSANARVASMTASLEAARSQVAETRAGGPLACPCRVMFSYLHVLARPRCD